MRASLPVLALLALVACQKQPAAGNGSISPAAPAASGPAAGKIDRSRAGQPAPDTEFEDPGGETVTLAEFRGKPLLLNFWATWCAPCKKELPTLDGLAAEQGDKLRVVSLSEDQNGRDKVDAYVAQAKFAKLDAWLDPKLAMTDSLKVNDL